jgi:hypothetical protein
MKFGGTMFFGCCCAALLVTVTASAAMGGPEPARWRPYALIVDLTDLPKRYACDDLWNKFRDVLKTLGANPEMKVTPYRCGRGAGDLARSPRVELFFKLPEALPSNEAHWHELDASTATIRLEPGAPASFDDSDCELMRQIKSALLPSLPARVIAYRLTCQAPPQHGPRFSLTVQTLRPVTVVMQGTHAAPAGG